MLHGCLSPSSCRCLLTFICLCGDVGVRQGVGFEAVGCHWLLQSRFVCEAKASSHSKANLIIVGTTPEPLR